MTAPAATIDGYRFWRQVSVEDTLVAFVGVNGHTDWPRRQMRAPEWALDGIGRSWGAASPRAPAAPPG